MSRPQQTIRPSHGTPGSSGAVTSWRTSLWLPASAVALVLAVKLTALLQLANHPLLQPKGVLDDGAYLKLAERVAHGDLALGPDVYFLSPFYTYFLGAILACGGLVFAARLSQVLLGTAAVVLTGLTGRRWFGNRAGWAAAAAQALTGLFTFNEILLLQSAVDPFLSSLALYALARALGGGTVAAFFASGAALGLLAVNRPNTLVAVVVVGVVSLAMRRSRRASMQVAAMALGVALAMSPFVIRNRVVAGEWALVTSHGGLNFYIGNHEGASGVWSMLPGISPSIEGQSRDAARIASAALGRPASAGDASDYYYALGWRWIREHPADAARLWIRKLGLTLSATDLALNYSYTYYARDESTVLSALVVGPWLLVPFGLVGLALGLRRANGAAARPGEAGPAAYAAWVSFVPGYVASLVVFFVASRYRLPLLVVWCVGTGHALVFASRCLAERRWRDVALAGAGVVGLGAVAFLPLEPDTGRQYERTERIVQLVAAGQDTEATALLAVTEARHPQRGLLFYRAGRAWQDRGDHARAAALFERALEADPGQADIRLGLGESLLALSRPADAVPHLEAARKAGVEPYGASLDLARAFQMLGRGDDFLRAVQDALGEGEAREADILALGAEVLQHGDVARSELVARKAVARWPASAAARELLGVALMLEGREVEGRVALGDAVRLDPSSATARYHLALALAQAGRVAEAARLAEDALRLQPDYPEARLLLERLGGR